MPELWEGSYPIDDEWIHENAGKEVALVFGIDLGDLIDLDGVEAMNDFVDNLTPGATLTDIRYFQHPAESEDELGDMVLIRAEGVLEDY